MTLPQTRRTALRPAALALGVALLASAAAQAQAPADHAAPAAAAAKPAAPTLTRTQFDALLATPAKVLVLDVRRADEISTIGGFPVYLNIQAAEVESRLAYLPKDRQIVPVSNHAARALKVAAVLKAHGYKVAGVVGAQNYEAEGGTLVGRKPTVAASALSDTAAVAAVAVASAD